MVGRPSKRTPEREARLLEALRAGNTRRDSSTYAGIEQHTFQRWMLRSAQFAQAVEKAEADAVVRHVANIAKAAQDGTWTASAWWLERRRPEDFAQRQRFEHTGPDGGPIELEERITLTEADLDQYLLALLERAGTRPGQIAARSQPRLASPDGPTNGSVAH